MTAMVAFFPKDGTCYRLHDMAESKQVAFRAEPELLDRLDRLVESMKRHPDYEGLDINRSVAVRVLVFRGLSALELKLGDPAFFEAIPRDPETGVADPQVLSRWVSRLEDTVHEERAILQFLRSELGMNEEKLRELEERLEVTKEPAK